METGETNRYHYFASSNFSIFVQIFSGSLDVYVGGGYDIPDLSKAQFS